jgi:cytochrome oxidase Cu insertion factor (SCO1/SenC/PrrC family)
MTRRRHRAALAAGLAMLLLAVGGRVAPAAADKALDDALFELQLVPLDGQTPAPFSLERLADGKKVTLAEHRGSPVILYFWATW